MACTALIQTLLLLGKKDVKDRSNNMFGKILKRKQKIEKEELFSSLAGQIIKSEKALIQYSTKTNGENIILLINKLP